MHERNVHKSPIQGDFAWDTVSHDSVEKRKTPGHSLTAGVQQELPPVGESSDQLLLNSPVMLTFKEVHVPDAQSNLVVFFMYLCVSKGFIYFFI